MTAAEKEFHRKARVVASCYAAVADYDEWQDTLRILNLGFAAAVLYMTDAATLTEDGQRLVTEAYDTILLGFKMPDSDYFDFNQLVDASIIAKEK